MSLIFGAAERVSAFTFAQLEAAERRYAAPGLSARVQHTRLVSRGQNAFEVWMGRTDDFPSPLAFAVNTAYPINGGLLWWPMSRLMWMDCQRSRGQRSGPRAALVVLQGHLQAMGWSDPGGLTAAWLLWEGFTTGDGWDDCETYELAALAVREDGYLLFDFTSQLPT
ncbi:MAG: hypothetical protein AAFV53_15380 [Myxococcota bacterium]